MPPKKKSMRHSDFVVLQLAGQGVTATVASTAAAAAAGPRQSGARWAITCINGLGDEHET